MISVDTRYDSFGLSPYPDSVNNYSKTANNGSVSTRTITEWLYNNAHKEKASKLWKCGTGAVELIDAHHHRFAHVCGCRSDICPSCSQNESDRHRQRYGRVLKKMRWISQIDGIQLGYCILTIPKHLRYMLLDDDMVRAFHRDGYECAFSGDMLKAFHRKGWECVSDAFGDLVEGATTTLHFFGEPGINSGVFNPHLNVLFPVHGSGHVDPDLLLTLREKWGEILSEWFGVDCGDQSNVWYGYRTTEAHQVHSIKYVTRSTVGGHFMDSPDEVRHFIAGLRYFNNVRWWGKLSYRNWRKYLEAIAESNNLAFDGIVREQKTDCECPICGDALKANINIKNLDIDLSEAEIGVSDEGNFKPWAVLPEIDVESKPRFSVVIVGDGRWFDNMCHWFNVGETGLKADLPTYIEYLFVKENRTIGDVQEHLKANYGIVNSDVVEIRSGNADLIESGVIKMTVFSHIRSIWADLYRERPDQFPKDGVFDLDEMLEDGCVIEDFREVYRRSKKFLDVALEIKESMRVWKAKQREVQNEGINHSDAIEMP